LASEVASKKSTTGSKRTALGGSSPATAAECATGCAHSCAERSLKGQGQSAGRHWQGD